MLRRHSSYALTTGLCVLAACGGNDPLTANPTPDPSDATAPLPSSSPPTDAAPQPPDASTADAGVGPNALHWRPPTLVAPVPLVLKSWNAPDGNTDGGEIRLDPTKDYDVSCDPASGGYIVVKSVKLVGGHHVVLRGCHLERAADTPNSVYPPPNGCEGNDCCVNVDNPGYVLNLREQTGVAYAEGIFIDARNSTSATPNYGIDGVNVGHAGARGVLSVSGPVTVGQHVQITFAHPTLADYPRVIEYVVKQGDDLAAVASGLAAAIRADATLKKSKTEALEIAAATGTTVLLDFALPAGNEVTATATSAAGTTIALGFDHPGGALRGGVVVLQNVRVVNVWSTACGHHADALQATGDTAKLYVDRFTGTTGYQGIQLQPAFNHLDLQLSRLNVRYLDPDYAHKNGHGDDTVGANGFAFWLGTGSATMQADGMIARYRLSDIFVDYRQNLSGAAWAVSSVSPQTRESVMYPSSLVDADPTRVEFPHLPPGMSVTGYVTQGLPPGGEDEVPEARLVDATGKVVYVPATEFLEPAPTD